MAITSMELLKLGRNFHYCIYGIKFPLVASTTSTVIRYSYLEKALWQLLQLL